MALLAGTPQSPDLHDEAGTAFEITDHVRWFFEDIPDEVEPTFGELEEDAVQLSNNI